MKACSYSSCHFDWPNFSNIPTSVTLQIYLLTLAVLSQSDSVCYWIENVNFNCCGIRHYYYFPFYYLFFVIEWLDFVDVATDSADYKWLRILENYTVSSLYSNSCRKIKACHFVMISVFLHLLVLGGLWIWRQCKIRNGIVKDSQGITSTSI